MTAERRFPKLDMQPLSGIMANLGHTWIDVLKVSYQLLARVHGKEISAMANTLPTGIVPGKMPSTLLPQQGKPANSFLCQAEMLRVNSSHRPSFIVQKDKKPDQSCWQGHLSPGCMAERSQRYSPCVMAFCAFLLRN